jgi:Flp pilus assembly protein protease CpaA
MEIPVSWLFGVVFLGCILATIYDVAIRRIPNVLTVGLMVIALAFSIAHGFEAVARSFGAMSAVLVLGTLAHARGAIGGGDVKLAAAVAAAVAAALSLPAALAFVLYTLVSGGALALIVLAFTYRGKVYPRMRVMFANLAIGILPPTGLGSRKMPYALAITCGLILVYGSRTILPFLRLA